MKPDINKIICIIASALCLLMLFSLSGCGGTSVDNDASPDATLATEPTAQFGGLEEMADTDNALVLDFQSPVEVAGVKTDGNTYTIGVGGTYLLTGNISDGQVVVDADKEDVWLILSDAHISSETSAPLYIADAKNTYLILKEGSDNSLTDTENYSTDAEGNPDATLFCKNDLIIGGGGTLTIDSNYNNAIHTKDTLVISSGDISINSVDTGIKAKDGLRIEGGTLNITCSGDGIQTTNSEDTSKGNMEILGGAIEVSSEKDAIQSENALTISGGTFNLHTGGGAENADYSYGFGGFMDFGYMYGSDEYEVSMKALKAQSTLTVSDGDFTIDSEDDAIHSNSQVSILGGEFRISSGDDGIHADDVLTLSGGRVDVSVSYEGFEGSEVIINGGEHHIKSADDGINSAGGGDTGYGGFGPDSFSDSSTYKLSINGGYTYVDAEGDGLDSNGSITVTDGTVIVNGPVSGGNSPFDWESECLVNGGTFIAAGSSQMMEQVSASSTQCSTAFYLSQQIPSGTLCNLSYSDGTKLTFAPAKTSSYLFISTPDIRQGSTCTLSVGGSHQGANTDGLFTDGAYSGGTIYAEITQDSIAAAYGTPFGGMGGMMGGPGGGMGGHGGDKPHW